MIKTKCIFDPPCKNDGTRICIMRYVKPFYKYDEWIRDLAPSEFILNMYRKLDIDWELFEKMYIKEMDVRERRILIGNLRKRHLDGEIITLLCWEKEDIHCHRRLLKKLIEEEKYKSIKVRISYYGEDGTIYSELDDYLDNEIELLGEWSYPFDKSSPAIGQIEYILQSDDCPLKLQYEKIYKVKIEKVG